MDHCGGPDCVLLGGGGVLTIGALELLCFFTAGLHHTLGLSHGTQESVLNTFGLNMR